MPARPQQSYKFWICPVAVLIFIQKIITWSTLQAHKISKYKGDVVRLSYGRLPEF